MSLNSHIEQHHKQSILPAILWSILLVFSLWIVYWIEIKFRLNFTTFGVYPRALKGVFGIIASPFIHSGIDHLYKNSIPILVLTASLFYFYKDIAWKSLCYGLLCSGLLTWIIGRSSYHIGASGMVYFLVAFLFFKGVRSKNYRLIALSLVVVFLYGSLVWGTLPGKPGISWEGHLSGFIAGFLLSFSLKSDHFNKVPPVYPSRPSSDDDDEFLQQFDEHGNFTPLDPEEDAIINFTQDSTADDKDEVIYKKSNS